MQINIRCFECSKKSEKDIPQKVVSINENNFYEFTCPYGHITKYYLNPYKFQLLFESGLNAILDGYYLESVLSITASLERFYEFYTKEILKTKGIKEEEIEEVFKPISRLSERQYGGFLMVYAITNGHSAKQRLTDKNGKFRNSVVHKGYIPNEIEVLKYASEVYKLVLHYYKELINISPQIEIENKISRPDLKPNDERMTLVTVIRGFALSETSIKQGYELDDYLNKVKELRQILGARKQ